MLKGGQNRCRRPARRKALYSEGAGPAFAQQTRRQPWKPLTSRPCTRCASSFRFPAPPPKPARKHGFLNSLFGGGSPALLDASRAEAAMRELQAKCAPLCPNGLLELAVLLSAALEARKHYAARGVPDDVYLATMGCFSRFLNETHRWTGRWQFDRGFWVWRQLCGRLLRLGTLEFEALPLPAELAGPLGAAAGAPALSVHIPGDAMCMPEALHASYARRADFFARDGALPLTYCRTWLLSPRVKELLPPGSGIRNFMEDYTLADWDPDDNSGRLWLFGAPGIPDAALPERTSLQRGAKELLLQGKPLGSGLGLLKL